MKIPEFRPAWLDEETDEEAYVQLDLTPKEAQALARFLRQRKLSNPMAVRLQDALRRAHLIPLPRKHLDWAEAEQAAQRRGSSLVEWLEDGSPKPKEDE